MEAQVDKAATYIGSRDTAGSVDKPVETPGDTMSKISLTHLISKIDTLADFLQKQSPVNNITVNNLGNKDLTSCVFSSKFTQTDLVLPPVDENVQDPPPANKVVATDAPNNRNKNNVDDIKCTKCSVAFSSVRDLVKHIDLQHDSNSNSQKFEQSCEICGRRFSSVAHLEEHIESDHGTSSVKCNFCRYSCTTTSHLEAQIAALHPGDGESSPPPL